MIELKEIIRAVRGLAHSVQESQHLAFNSMREAIAKSRASEIEKDIQRYLDEHQIKDTEALAELMANSFEKAQHHSDATTPKAKKKVAAEMKSG